MMASMGGADAIIFTGGIGENSPEMRARICQGLEWAGVQLDTDRNSQTRAKSADIGLEGSKLPVWVIPTDEELLIARDTVRCVLGQPHPA